MHLWKTGSASYVTTPCIKKKFLERCVIKSPFYTRNNEQVKNTFESLDNWHIAKTKSHMQTLASQFSLRIFKCKLAKFH